MASNPSAPGGVSECCGQVVFWKGTPTGSEMTLGPLACYLASASPKAKAKDAILFIHDAFGWTLVNNRLATDQLARSTGCDVYLPDLFNGQGIPESSGDLLSKRNHSWMDSLKTGVSMVVSAPSLISFLSKHTAKTTHPKLNEIIPLMKAQYTGIGAIGFCWGGKYSAWLASQGKVSCFAAGHPSLLDASDLNIDSVPGLIVTAKKDPIFSESLRKKAREQPKVQVVEYDGVVHGFCIRGREDEEIVVKARQDAMGRFSSFLKEHLVGASSEKKA